MFQRNIRLNIGQNIQGPYPPVGGLGLCGREVPGGDRTRNTQTATVCVATTDVQGRVPANVRADSAVPERESRPGSKEMCQRAGRGRFSLVGGRSSPRQSRAAASRPEANPSN